MKTQDQLFPLFPMYFSSLDGHILILNNAKYGEELGQLSEEQILGGPAVLSRLLSSGGVGIKKASHVPC